MWSREFHGRRVIRWTPHPETVNRIVSLAGKVVSAPTLSPLIVGKISDKLVWVTTHRECKMYNPHVTWDTLSQWHVFSQEMGGWYMIQEHRRTEHRHLCVVKSWWGTNRQKKNCFKFPSAYVLRPLEVYSQIIHTFTFIGSDSVITRTCFLTYPRFSL